jgi:hypothetical protein
MARSKSLVEGRGGQGKAPMLEGAIQCQRNDAECSQGRAGEGRGPAGGAGSVNAEGSRQYIRSLG